MVTRVTTFPDNLEMSGNFTVVREMSGNLPFVRELSEECQKKTCQEKMLQCVHGVGS